MTFSKCQKVQNVSMRYKNRISGTEENYSDCNVYCCAI